MKKIVRFVAVIAAILLLVFPTVPAEAWHGGGAAGVMFSKQLSPLPPGLLPPIGYRTCMIGNFPGIDPNFVQPLPPAPPMPNPGHAMIHHWKYLSRTGGPVTLLITATSVSPADSGFQIKATATHEPKPPPSGPTQTAVSVAHSGVSGPAGDRSVTMRVPTLPNVAYDLTIEVVSPPSGAPQGGHHYKVGALGPGASSVEIGYGNPTLEYLESGINRWAINAGIGEAVSLKISVDPSMGGIPNQATSVQYRTMPAFASPPPWTTAPVSPGSPIMINFTNTTGVPQTYIVAVNANGHYKLEKINGPDKGIYVLNCRESEVGIDIKPGDFPNSINRNSEGTVPVAIFSRPDFDASTLIDPATIIMAGAKVKIRNDGKPMAGVEDINGDGLMDLVVHIETQDLNLAEGQTMAMLMGLTYNLIPFYGRDSVNIVQ